MKGSIQSRERIKKQIMEIIISGNQGLRVSIEIIEEILTDMRKTQAAGLNSRETEFLAKKRLNKR